MLPAGLSPPLFENEFFKMVVQGAGGELVGAPRVCKSIPFVCRRRRVENGRQAGQRWRWQSQYGAAHAQRERDGSAHAAGGGGGKTPVRKRDEDVPRRRTRRRRRRRRRWRAIKYNVTVRREKRALLLIRSVEAASVDRTGLDWTGLHPPERDAETRARLQ